MSPTSTNPVPPTATAMTGTPRRRARARTMDDIVRIGREHLSTHGAAGLSLRAVARDLGVVSSAVYRYVKNRDELLTLLVVDAYTDLGDAVDDALSRTDAADHRGRFGALAAAVRSWALREPARYGLLFGSPVPGYRAPAERTTGPGTRVVTALAAIVDAANVDTNDVDAAGGRDADDGDTAGGRGAPEAVPPSSATDASVPHSLTGDFASIRTDLGLSLPDAAVARTILVWTGLFGAVSFEVFGQYGPDTFTNPDALFDGHVRLWADILSLP